MNKQLQNKKLQEKTILEYFSVIYAEYPGGKILQTESPDFILLPFPKKRIGIEITRLNQPKYPNQKFNSLQVSNVENSVIDEARSVFESKQQSFPLFLSISFKHNVRILKSQIKIVARKIAHDVLNQIRGADPKSNFSFSTEKGLAENYIRYIEGIHLPEINASLWLNAGGFEVPALSREFIVKKIASKEKKIHLYRRKRLDSIWLLLVTDSNRRSTSFNLQNQIESWNIPSDFDKVFLLEIIEKKLYKIK
jgi:hypothetical protein